MKSLLVVLFALLSSLLVAQSLITIEPNASVTIENPVTVPIEYQIKNKSNSPIDVAIFSKRNRTGGFGLGANGRESITIQEDGTIFLTNNSDKLVTIENDYKIVKEKAKAGKTTSVSLNFRNNSNESIPLIIPTVMNPNLSPFSNSRVTLKIGQKVYFRYKGKRRVLLVISEDNYQDENIEVSELVNQRKQEINLG